eukprot:CAMPEP_0179470130 /NCGR_PEP_ID=MMETSP0799-20121207/50640_1 /TAXON_ID=46947 /ORGANISM="Geminigera cryophila, Strain CCMP2564" /LENGTH=132 /DNA_ID=CAMNT_0021276993 /DNA_START=126 /DNA_END=524 /DNA_ORIENTATION=-
MVWSKAIGVDAAILGARFLKERMGVQCVVDPFCGTGTILAAANILGMDAVGVDLSLAKTQRALRLCLQNHVLSENYDEESYRGMLPKLQNLLLHGKIPAASLLIEQGARDMLAVRENNQKSKKPRPAGADSD